MSLFPTQGLLLTPNRYNVGNSVVLLVFINDIFYQELGHTVRTREVLVPSLWELLALMDARILSGTDHIDMVQIPTFTKYANENAYGGQAHGVATDGLLSV